MICCCDCCLFLFWTCVLFTLKCTCCCVNNFTSFCTCCICCCRCYCTFYCLGIIFLITSKDCFTCLIIFRPFICWICTISMTYCFNRYFFCICMLCIILICCCCCINCLTSFCTCWLCYFRCYSTLFCFCFWNLTILTCVSYCTCIVICPRKLWFVNMLFSCCFFCSSSFVLVISNCYFSCVDNLSTLFTVFCFLLRSYFYILLCF